VSSGPLLGTGLLAIWNGMERGFEAEFVRWHAREHIPERLSVPGFLRARRYFALEGEPFYFNFYEVSRPEVLVSPPYLDRLNNPSEWTRRVIPHFNSVSRTLCRVPHSVGFGVAGTIGTLRLEAEAGALRSIADAVAGSADVSAVHLLERVEATVEGSAESAMRSSPDQSSRTIVLVEGADRANLKAVLETLASDDAVAAACGARPSHRGLYQLDFLMERARHPDGTGWERD
jgi:hypothetical protein